MRFELIEQNYEYADEKLFCHDINKADTIHEKVLGEFPTLPLALRMRKFLVEEKRYSSDTPEGVSTFRAFYIRQKE